MSYPLPAAVEKFHVSNCGLVVSRSFDLYPALRDKISAIYQIMAVGLDRHDGPRPRPRGTLLPFQVPRDSPGNTLCVFICACPFRA